MRIPINTWLQKVRSFFKPGTPGHTLSAGPVAWSSLAGFLEDLEMVARDHPELFDTDVRERMWSVVDHVLIKQSTGIVIPEAFGMFSPEGNQRVRDVFTLHLNNLRKVFAAFNLDTEEKRLHSFFNPKLHTESGMTIDEFFGHP